MLDILLSCHENVKYKLQMMDYGSWNIFLGLIHIFDKESPSPALVCRFAVSSKLQRGCDFEDNIEFLNF